MEKHTFQWLTTKWLWQLVTEEVLEPTPMFFVIITGENGDTGKRFLTGSGNLFERNSKDEFGIDCVDLGMIKKIEIGHDGWGFGSDWFLEKVVVKSDTLQKDFFFLFGDWINGKDDVKNHWTKVSTTIGYNWY